MKFQDSLKARLDIVNPTVQNVSCRDNHTFGCHYYSLFVITQTLEREPELNVSCTFLRSKTSTKSMQCNSI